MVQSVFARVGEQASAPLVARFIGTQDDGRSGGANPVDDAQLHEQDIGQVRAVADDQLADDVVVAVHYGDEAHVRPRGQRVRDAQRGTRLGGQIDERRVAQAAKLRVHHRDDRYRTGTAQALQAPLDRRLRGADQGSQLRIARPRVAGRRLPPARPCHREPAWAPAQPCMSSCLRILHVSSNICLNPCI